MRSTLQALLVGLLLVGFRSSPASAQKTATLSGTITDAQSGDALPGANIVLVGSGLGAASDMVGRYLVRGIPPGTYTLRSTYVGYESISTTITLLEAADVRRDFKLSSVAIEGEPVVVTAQAAGQKGAINRQLSAMPMMNVVSADRIQELPDANAAESIGRLPGVSLIRTGGEGSQVVIRGLSPQYNQITIAGVELPGNVTSVNNIVKDEANQAEFATSLLGDRGMDLSMISSSMLGGIEVIKAITPDMDAAVLGGVVNVAMRKAVSDNVPGAMNQSWLPRFDLLSQVGYNDLKETRNDYKFVGSVETRLLDDGLGVFLQGTAERRNLSANVLTADYTLKDKDHGEAGTPDIGSFRLADILRTRERLGGSLVIDYQHHTGGIDFMTSVSRTTTTATRNEEDLRWKTDQIYFSAEETNNELSSMSNILSVTQDVSSFRVAFKASHSYSESSNPEDLKFNFYQHANAGFADRGDLSHVAPKTLALLAQPNPSKAILDVVRLSHALSQERTWNGSLDLETMFMVSSPVTGNVKCGGAVQHRTREFDIDGMTGTYRFGGRTIMEILNQYPSLSVSPPDQGGAGGDRIGMPSFLDENYRPESFLNGEYPLPHSLKTGPMRQILPMFQRYLDPENPWDRLESVINDYSGIETKGAAYAMFTLNIGEDIAILPGIRYQNLTTTYTAMRGMAVPGGIQGADTTVTQSHGYFLPMGHVRYRPLDWLQVHCAYTNTLNYPDHSAITPRYFVGTGYISYNNYTLRPARSENFDLNVSLKSNALGLFSVNGFFKRIKDLIFFSRTWLSDLSGYPDLPQGSDQLVEFNTYINNPFPVDVKGIEAEWQTNLWYLPAPLSGLVLNINYTRIFSEARYPKSVVYNAYDDEGNLTQTVVDTFYTTRLLNQPNHILNLSLGYDYKGFSARLSMIYQDDIFKRPDFWMQNRVNSAQLTRWDLALKQELPWFGIQLYLFLTNITSAKEIDVNQKTLLLANWQHYGMSGDLGLRVTF